MKRPEITKLYKYRAYNENTISILVNKELWFPKPEMFNDPFDCDFRLDHSLSYDEYLELRKLELNRNGKSEQEIKANIKELNRIQKGKVPINFLNNAKTGAIILSDTIKQYGILTLSEISNNILMWSHYSDEHKGICIEFERNENNFLGTWPITRPVKYLRNYPRIRAMDMARKRDGSVMETMLRTKSCDWKYEKEWRALLTKGNRTYPVPNRISGIIFGLRTPKEHVRTIKNILKGDKISFMRAETVEGQFRVKIVKDTT